MALAQHFIANNGFNPVNLPLNSNPLAGEGLLQTEAFPGELASLRAQLSQMKTPIDKAVSLKKNQEKLSQASFVTPLDNSLKQTQMADQLIEMMPTGLVMLDGNGVVVKINKVARDLLEEPILGQLWFSVIARSFKPRADDWHEVSLKDGRRVKLEIASLGNQPGQLIMITDLTETRLLQDKVGQMQRLSSLGRMVSTLAHQIRTPLSAAMLYSANLSNNKLSESARGSFQEKLNLRLQDLEQQINDMLLFSKSGKEQVVSSLSVNELINDAIQAMDALIVKANTKVNLHLSNVDHHILGNKNALTGAIQNLVHNALQAGASANVDQSVINIQVYSNKKSIFISVKDNGAGMDAEKLKGIAIERGVLDAEAAARMPDKEAFSLIFAPGFSTKTEISEVSGRGVGMDVVKTKIAQLNGTVNIDSEMGVGTILEIKVPLTLAILPTLMVVVGKQTFALSLAAVNEIFHLDLTKTNNVDGQLTIIVREKAIPLFYLDKWLVRDCESSARDKGHVVIVQVGNQQIAFVVDRLIGQEEVVIKPLDSLLHGTPGMAGATITSDGGIALIIDIPNMLRFYAKKLPMNKKLSS